MYLGTCEKIVNIEKSEDDKKKDKECWKLVAKKVPVGLQITSKHTRFYGSVKPKKIGTDQLLPRPSDI